MTYALFGFENSGSVAIEIALDLCEVEYRFVRCASWEEGASLDELTKVNPLQQIPTLQLPDGSVMTESAAILIHLGLQFPRANLLPQDSSKRAQVLRGLVFIAANCYSAISVIDYPMRWCLNPDEDSNKRVRAGAKQRLHTHWEIFADQFPAEPFLNGDELGALDLLAVIVSRWSGTRKHLQQARPDFYATLERIEKYPAVASVLSRRWKS